MLKHSILALFIPVFIFLPLKSNAQNNPIKTLQAKALADTQAYQLIESITTEVGPRLAGSEGDAKAVAWAEKNLKALGFDKVYKEVVPVRNWQRGEISVTTTSPFKHIFAATALGGSVSTPKEGIKAEIVQFNNLTELKNAPQQQVLNKIVYISTKMQRDKSGKSYSNTVEGRTKGAIYAAHKGAKALIIRSLGTDSSRFPHTGSMHYSKSVVKIPAAAISNADADLLERLLTHPTPVVLNFNLQTTEQTWKDSYNVIAEITGSEQPDEYVVLAAHLDSWDLGTGAIDDGAGIGIVMTAAKLVKEMGQPKRSIRVILFANEEFGLKGAKTYAQKHSAELEQIIVATESDFGAGKVWRFDSRFSQNKLKHADSIYNLVTVFDIKRGHNKAYGGPDVSVLAKLGVPVVSWVQDGTDYFDYHHTANDTFDKVKLENIQQNVAVYATFTYWVANSAVYFK